MKTVLALASLIVIVICLPSHANSLDYAQAADQKNRKQYNAAIKSFTKLLKDNPQDPKLLVSRGQVYHDCHMLDKALSDYSAAIKLEPKNSANYVYKADALLEQKKFKEAENNAFMAKELDPSSATAYVVYGSALRSQGRFKQAIDAFDQALAITPEYIRAKNERALCQRSTKN